MSIVKELREGLVVHVYESVEWLKSFSDNKEYEKYKREHISRDLDCGARTGRCVVTTESGSRGLVSREEVRKAFCNWVMHKGAPYEFLFELENMKDYEEYL